MTTLAGRRRELVAAAVGIAVLGGGLYYWQASARLKSENASKALTDAERAYYSGNTQLARSDLEKVAERYAGTAAGVQATLLLAQVLYQDGKFADGVAKLEAAEGSSAAKPFASGIHALIAAGFESQGKFAEAADRYARAAESAPFKDDKDLRSGDQAHALARAGKKVEAKAIWARLAADDTSPMQAEARLRLGELVSASN